MTFVVKVFLFRLVRVREVIESKLTNFSRSVRGLAPDRAKQSLKFFEDLLSSRLLGQSCQCLMEIRVCRYIMILSDSFRLLVPRNVFLDISSPGREPVPMLERHVFDI